jgi:hypothetical protein
MLQRPAEARECVFDPAPRRAATVEIDFLTEFALPNDAHDSATRPAHRPHSGMGKGAHRLSIVLNA